MSLHDALTQLLSSVSGAGSSLHSALIPGQQDTQDRQDYYRNIMSMPPQDQYNKQLQEQSKPVSTPQVQVLPR